MIMRAIHLLFIALGIAILAALIFWFFRTAPIERADITNFDECAQAGFPISESYPPQCRTKDGRVFTQDIGNELEKADLIKVSKPRPNQNVRSPLLIDGEARGNWYFEASFPVKLVDANGRTLVSTFIQAEEEWMTTNFVPFKKEITFSVSAPIRATLILEKDNPSGLPEHDDQLRIPLILQP